MDTRLGHRQPSCGLTARVAQVESVAIVCGNIPSAASLNPPFPCKLKPNVTSPQSSHHFYARLINITNSARPLMMELGIEILSQPATISVDFVFIHGLDGDRTRTWTSEKTSEIWPQALLPRDFPHARILSWGYQSSLFQANSRDSITQRSLGLLGDLRSVRYHTGTENVELVFVCHSLGGLICKQMLIDSRNGPYIKDRAIYDLTVGIVFLGTPHAPSSPLLLDSI